MKKMDSDMVYKTVKFVFSIFVILTSRSSAVSVYTPSLARTVRWPCTDTSAIQWTRHPTRCSRYYICHFGQPLAMPDCPFGQAWSVKALNCVPRNSRWDDCNVVEYSVGNRTGYGQGNGVTYDKPGRGRGSPYPSRVPSTPKTWVKKVRARTTQHPFWIFLSSSTTARPQAKIPTTARPSQNDYGQRFKPKKNRKPLKPGRYRPAWNSPFQPGPRMKYYTFLNGKKNLWQKKSPKGPRGIFPPYRFQTSTTTTTRRPYSYWIHYTIVPNIPWKNNRDWLSPKIKLLPDGNNRLGNQSTVWSLNSTPKPRLETRPTPTRDRTTRLQWSTAPQTWKPEGTTNWKWIAESTSQPTRQRTTSSPSPGREATTTVTSRVWGSGNTTGRLPSGPDPTDWTIWSLLTMLPRDHPCRRRPGQLAAHPEQCHWYYNCTLPALGRLSAVVHGDDGGSRQDPVSALRQECRYPRLFDRRTSRCREFINVRCGRRFEPVDPCEYQKLQCKHSNCIPCRNRYGACRGRSNGIYPFQEARWTPTFVTCYQQRNIAQDDCQPPKAIFSPEVKDCVALTEVPKVNGGLRPDCLNREDGVYPDEQGRCGVFFECNDRRFAGYDQCPSGTTFDPATLRCQSVDLSAPPCGEGQPPSCSERQDGYHADPFGRCPYYFQCRRGRFVRHLTCDFGSFDPLSQECVIPVESIPQPCGLLPNPCQDRASGLYPDEEEGSGCRRYLECSRGMLLSRASCPEGSVFSAISGRCDRPENAPAPCGVAPTCQGRSDGSYPALTRGCSFYFQCQGQRLAGLRQCGVEDGGFYFNDRTGRCDSPQNICPPCGYRWWGCPRTLNYTQV